jgi:hypothetical protein
MVSSVSQSGRLTYWVLRRSQSGGSVRRYHHFRTELRARYTQPRAERWRIGDPGRRATDLLPECWVVGQFSRAEYSWQSLQAA